HMAARADVKDDWFTNSLVEIARFMEELHRREAVRQERDYDGLEAELRDLEKKKLWGWKGRNRPFSREIDRTTALNLRDSAKKELGEVLDHCDADLAAALFGELRPLVDSYERLKTRAGKLDFLDLLVLTRDLLRSDKAVRNELQERFTHLLVDEFQDTDPLQAEILLLLAADNPSENDYTRAVPIAGKLFAVGDPKQSIYRFRRADVALYEMTKKRLKDRGAEVVHLTTSFRSAPSIQEAVNQAFAPLMQGNEDGSQAEYVALQPFREEPLLESGQPQPTLVVLPVPRPYSKWGKIANWVIDESYPDAVGAFVDWLVNKSGWKTTERGGGPLVPIEPRHICLLFKRFQNYGKDVTRSYVRALEARRVPHVLIGGRSYHAREEVLALRNAIAAIEWPEDELSMFATLRGPFFALGDDQLLAYRRAVGGSLHPFKKVDAAAITDLTRPVTEALSILGELHRRRNRRPIADTIVRLLEATRAHAGIAIWPTGEQALANVFRILDLARRFESQGATSFRSFVLRLQEDAERGGAAEAPVVEEGTEGVRMMTVHRAKGLEFPVVVLVDPTANAVMREPSRYVDSRVGLWAMPLAGCSPIELVEKREEVLRHDREEAHRLMYVAATRARDLLVVPAVGDEAISGWVDVLHPVMYPAQERRREGERAPGCPQFTGDSVKERPAETVRGTSDSVAPGLHRPRLGSHRVVWWDPNVLDLDKEHDVGLRQQRILAADDGGVATEGERLHAAWQATRVSVRDAGAKPSLAIQTVTGSKDAAAPGAAVPASLAAVPSVPHETTGASRSGRPRGKRFGVLVHAILAATPLDASPAKLAEVARAEGRHVG
ncbi:MAG: ATP-dependent nuclease, subunit, partial [Myxococcaceae bacterium]|nr:ATP-dependent nuclease, subunit [Myxococcaceae bacterium]